MSARRSPSEWSERAKRTVRIFHPSLVALTNNTLANTIGTAKTSIRTIIGKECPQGCGYGEIRLRLIRKWGRTDMRLDRHVVRPKQHSNLRVTVITCVLRITTPRSLIHTARANEPIVRLLLIPAAPSRSRPKELHDICASRLSVWML